MINGGSKMNIQEIKEAFPDSEIREGDYGKYIEIRLASYVYLRVFDVRIDSELEIATNSVPVPYISSIEDVKILYQLFNGKT